MCSGFFKLFPYCSHVIFLVTLCKVLALPFMPFFFHSWSPPPLHLPLRLSVVLAPQCQASHFLLVLHHFRWPMFLAIPSCSLAFSIATTVALHASLDRPLYNSALIHLSHMRPCFTLPISIFAICPRRSYRKFALNFVSSVGNRLNFQKFGENK